MQDPTPSNTPQPYNSPNVDDLIATKDDTPKVREFHRRMFRRSLWGPVDVQSTEHGVVASTPESGELSIDLPPARRHLDTVVEALLEGVPVTVDRVERFVLTQPRRLRGPRAARLIEVSGPIGTLPHGTVLRARNLRGVALETGEGERLIRPRLSVHPRFVGPRLTPRVDMTLPPQLIALWAAVWVHLNEALRSRSLKV